MSRDLVRQMNIVPVLFVQQIQHKALEMIFMKKTYCKKCQKNTEDIDVHYVGVYCKDCGASKERVTVEPKQRLTMESSAAKNRQRR